MIFFWLRKEIFKVELGYAFSMLFVLLNNILSDTSLRKLVRLRPLWLSL